MSAWIDERTHDDCARCERLTREAIEAAEQYDKDSWTSVESSHGATVWRSVGVAETPQPAEGETK